MVDKDQADFFIRRHWERVTHPEGRNPGHVYLSVLIMERRGLGVWISDAARRIAREYGRKLRRTASGRR